MDVVFDIGNVIFEWNPQKLLDSLFACKSESKEAMENIIAHDDWQMLDKGTSERRRSRRLVVKSLGK